MIREANVYDIPRINELGEVLNNNFSQVNDLNDMLNDDISLVYVYEIDNKVVGFITATHLYDTCDILSLVVDINYRRLHIASNLLNYLISECGESLKLMTLEVATKNKAAISLYEKFNFNIVNIRQKYYKDDDAYLMARKSE